MPGSYGAGLQSMIDEGVWKSTSDLAENYITGDHTPTERITMAMKIKNTHNEAREVTSCCSKSR